MSTRNIPIYLPLLTMLLLTGCQPVVPEALNGLPEVLKEVPEALIEVPEVPEASNEASQLAWIGNDGNVYITALVDGALGEPRAVTDDATAAPEATGRSYHRLAWSRAGKLAVAAIDVSGAGTSSELLVVDPQADDPPRTAQRVGADGESFVIYIHWAPQPCDESGKCQRLAYLVDSRTRENAVTVDLHLAEIDRQGVTNLFLAQGRPFYFSWSPNGEGMLWHTGGSTRLNPAAQIQLYEVARDRAQPIGETVGSFVAPAWQPSGDGWLYVAEEEGQSVLRFVSSSDERTVVTTEHDVVFAWSSDGTKVAYATRRTARAPFVGPIHLYDIESGESVRLTDEGLHVQAFSWSPDGARIAYINWLNLPSESWAQWRTVNVATGEDRGFKAFYPSFAMRMYIGSFNQYAQSHRLWSSDSRYLVFADRDQIEVERVWLVDTLAEKSAKPLFVGEGAIGIWAWEQQSDE